MKAVILAAGRGTRMGSLTQNLPKPLVPVVDVPAIVRVIYGLRDSGISDFILVTGYLGNMVRQRLGNGNDLDVNIRYTHQEEQKGTAHALLLAEEHAAGSGIFLAFADIITSHENYAAVQNRFVDQHCDLVGGIRRVDDPHRAAAVYLDAHWNIQKMIEKPEKGTSTTPWTHAGLYCFRPEIFSYLRRVQPSPRGELEIADAVTMMISEGKRCRGQELTGYWKDLATPQDAEEAGTWLRQCEKAGQPI